MPEVNRTNKSLYNFKYYRRRRAQILKQCRRYYLSHRPQRRRYLRSRRQQIRDYDRQHYIPYAKHPKSWRENHIRNERKFKKLHPWRSKAYEAVRQAKRTGRLKRPSRCSKCKKFCKPEAHHHKGYRRKDWLNVLWLCTGCHRFSDLAMKSKSI